MSATRDAWTHWHNTRLGTAPASTRAKYGAKVVHVNGLRFDSQREAARYAVAHTQSVVIAGTTYGNATSDVTNASPLVTS